MAGLFAVDDFEDCFRDGVVRVVRADELSGLPGSAGSEFYLARVDADVASGQLGGRRRTVPEVRWVRIRDHPLLFEEFARLPHAPDSFAAFAQKYGFLYSLDYDPGRHFFCDLKGSGRVAVEEVDEWVYAHTVFHQAWRYWMALRNQDEKSLLELICWKEGGLLWSSITGIDEPVGCYLSERILADAGIVRKDAFGVAKFALIEAIGDVMRTIGHYSVDFCIRQKRSPDIRISPVNLVGAMAMQFALAVSGEKEYRQCRTCGAPFEVTPGSARTNKEFCSAACRVKAYCRRQSEARRMYAEGLSLTEIAEKLETDTDRVEFWLAKTRQQRTRKAVEKGRSK